MRSSQANRYSLDSPLSLKTYCVNSFCANLDLICSETKSTTETDDLGWSLPDETDRVQAGDEDSVDVVPMLSKREEKVYKFSAGLVYLPSEISEMLLERLSASGKLTDAVFSLFDHATTRLCSVRIVNASRLTPEALKTLSGHNIVKLEMKNLNSRVTTVDVIENLNEWTRAHLTQLNISKSRFVLIDLSPFARLTSLNVSGTEFNRMNLEMAVRDLPALTSLDISCTRVTDISALLGCKERLQSLSLYSLNLPASASEQIVDVLVKLGQLRHLDVSETKNDQLYFNVPSGDTLNVSELLLRHDAWPHLVSLDISGKDNINVNDLIQFVHLRKNLTFLGLMLTEVSKDGFFQHEQVRHGRRLVVSGSANEEQIVVALKRYMDRLQYVQKSLYYLFRLSHGYTLPRVDIIKLVLAASRNYPNVFHIQVPATACLYNLCKKGIGQKLHPRILGDIVKADLDAMETFPRNQQLQKNVLITICNDRILQHVAFDKYRCVRLVMDCLCAWQDNSMNRMCVAICSILAARISTQKTSKLGSMNLYMKKLLSIVQKKMEDQVNDDTLKFTLSALWNLTDESPLTCEIFLSEGGINLFLRVADVFSGQLSVKTKILGLLNNIAEVRTLREHLIFEKFLQFLRNLLFSENIEVSYFSAGIAAHIISGDCWPDNLEAIKQQLILDLAVVVQSWQNPVNEMVAYRSFRPFFWLMQTHQVSSVQLWAVWAINHVCSKNPKRYCPMFVEQKGDVVLLRMVKHQGVHPSVRNLCLQVITTLITYRIEMNRHHPFVPDAANIEAAFAVQEPTVQR